ncbi:(2Fe-2S)-binding protein [Labrenzia sp. OB1]|uniref:(2Fe-2S)-binding protein n=1 Tax=Labrenzia sp. OB1 TaxID=1561204 RepID=UPI0007B1DC31|nr:(2Fe-2S)-binding protein [Labrenzia sp. OB1]KZM50867.1 NAD(FAD)-dependent dehydrogenase [Labrenzia sp. OB1]
MKTVSQLRKLPGGGRQVRVTFAGTDYQLCEGGNLAAELLAAGTGPFRYTPVSGAPRNPYCMMGACFDCLVEIDGVIRQACMTEVREGLSISRPAAREAEHD